MFGRKKVRKSVRPVVICKACELKRSKLWENLVKERKRQEFMKFVVETGNDLAEM